MRQTLQVFIARVFHEGYFTKCHDHPQIFRQIPSGTQLAVQWIPIFQCCCCCPLENVKAQKHFQEHLRTSKMGKQNKTKTNPNNTNSSGIPNTKMVSIVGRFAINFFLHQSLLSKEPQACAQLCCCCVVVVVAVAVVVVCVVVAGVLLLLLLLCWSLDFGGTPRTGVKKPLENTHARGALKDLGSLFARQVNMFLPHNGN